MLKILYKDKDYFIISKPQGMPSQPDLTGANDALTSAKAALSALGEKSDLWLVHRLDRVVGGVIAFARNKESAAYLSELAGTEALHKEYLAVVDGAASGDVLTDYIYKDAAKGKAFIVDNERKNAKKAVLEYEKIAEADTERGIRTLIRVKLHTGRFHQIRAQLASRKLPIAGDGKYGSHDNKAKMPALHSVRLAFNIKNKSIEAFDLPNIEAYPWNLFKEEFFT